MKDICPVDGQNIFIEYYFITEYEGEDYGTEAYVYNE